MLADARSNEDVRRRATATYATLDPVRLLKTIREVQQELVALADRPVVGRRRPDPLARVTELLREWFEAEPWRTSRELFERLQEAHPGLFPDGQLRTLQRRVKTWRHALAHKMVFGVTASGEMPGHRSTPLTQ